MGELATNAAKKALAVVVLVAAAYLLFKLVIGVIASVAWFIAAVVAVIAIVWAVRTL